MKNICSQCGQEIRDSSAPVERVYVKIAAPIKFGALCRTLTTMIKDEKFRAPLLDFPKALERYGQLTDGQWRFFAVIHSQCTGSWPSRDDFQVEDTQVVYSEAPDDSVVPF
jgi:hypothetical protein